jgi:NADH:ubiquinone oxidoreductase subunit E
MRLKPAILLVGELSKCTKKKNKIKSQIPCLKRRQKIKSLKTLSQIATIAYNLNIIYYHILSIAKFD